MASTFPASPALVVQKQHSRTVTSHTHTPLCKVYNSFDDTKQALYKRFSLRLWRLSNRRDLRVLPGVTVRVMGRSNTHDVTVRSTLCRR